MVNPLINLDFSKVPLFSQEAFKSKIVQLYHGSCLDYIDKIPNRSLDGIMTDPPFYILTQKNIGFKNRANIILEDDFDDFKSLKHFLNFTRLWVSKIVPKLKENAFFVCFFGGQYISYLRDICIENGLNYKNILVWHKTNPVPRVRKNGFVSSAEFILFMNRGKPFFNFIDQNKMHIVFSFPFCMGKERLKDYSIKIKGKYPSLYL